MLAVIDYGGGNLGSLLAALERRGAPYFVTGEPERLDDASAAIFPGDGAFGATMSALHQRGLDAAMQRLMRRGAPYLGICVGMQILYGGSTEFGGARGLGVLDGEVSRFEHAPRVPHMGWSALEPLAAHPFVEGIASGEYVYFLHSYRAPVGPATVAAATHGERFSAIVAQRNVMGVQFHPEKSQRTGAKLLDNFLRMVQKEPKR